MKSLYYLTAYIGIGQCVWYVLPLSIDNILDGHNIRMMFIILMYSTHKSMYLV